MLLTAAVTAVYTFPGIAAFDAPVGRQLLNSLFFAGKSPVTVLPVVGAWLLPLLYHLFLYGVDAAVGVPVVLLWVCRCCKCAVSFPPAAVRAVSGGCRRGGGRQNRVPAALGRSSEDTAADSEGYETSWDVRLYSNYIFKG